MHDVDLSQVLHFAESNFLAALEDGTKMLSSYQHIRAALSDALSIVTKTGNAGDDTFIFANLIAARISILASCFLDINREAEPATSQLLSDCDTIVHQMAALNLNAQTKYLLQASISGSPCSPTHSSVASLHTESPSLFLTSAYQWLLDNLHNPYPTAEVKTRIAATSSCKVSSVNSWFVNARRRIGWTTLCRERFSNCRADMIDAAYRALVKDDPQRTLSPELRHSFIAMKVAAEGLHSSTSTRSTFTGDLDAIIKDMTTRDKQSIEVGKHCQVEQEAHAKVARDSYPSPDRSITASPVSALDASLVNESEGDEDTTPPIIAGCKRRRSSIEPIDQPPSPVKRPIKRLRVSTTSRTHLPSPLSSTDGIDVPSDDGSPEPAPVYSAQPTANNEPSSRKRRLSNANTTREPKRPRDSLVVPPADTISNPLPSSNVENQYSIDDWFNTDFDALFAIPPPVDATGPDSSALWEVELFSNYCIPGSQKHVPKCPPASMPCTQIPASTDLSDFDNLLRSIGGDTFVTHPENALLADVTGASYPASFDLSIPDMSQTHIDWTSFADYPDVQQPFANSRPLPEIDLSMLQLPRIIPNVDCQEDPAPRQIKLHQLHAMQEAVRQMEQELQAEGVVI